MNEKQEIQEVWMFPIKLFWIIGEISKSKWVYSLVKLL